VLASLDQSLKRMGLDYVDIFYSHRFDADTPLEETAGALATAVHSGKALYVGISSYSPGKTREMAQLLAEHKVPLLIHQPSYNMLNRWIEEELLDTLDDIGAGSIAFTPLAQGLLTSKYLNGIPQDARVNKPGGGSLKEEHLSAENIEHVRKLNELAERRGQSLAQMALAWALRGGRVTSVLIGASRAEQVRENVGALKNLDFTSDELAQIDQHAREGGINLWEKPSTDQRI
jgi:L-glyceraldehyde 3-phosphate reductase